MYKPTAEHYNEIWSNPQASYRGGSTAERLLPFLKIIIPKGSTVSDFGSGTGRATRGLLEFASKVNMVDWASVALEDDARSLIGERVTYTVAPLEKLPADFPHANWGICINVLMVVDPLALQAIMQEMRRTCDNLIIEVYDMIDIRLGRDMTTIKGDAKFWFNEMSKYWPKVESYSSPEHARRYITIGRS